jgi:hypothetical protein
MRAIEAYDKARTKLDHMKTVMAESADQMS